MLLDILPSSRSWFKLSTQKNNSSFYKNKGQTFFPLFPPVFNPDLLATLILQTALEAETEVASASFKELWNSSLSSQTSPLLTQGAKRGLRAVAAQAHSALEKGREEGAISTTSLLAGFTALMLILSL